MLDHGAPFALGTFGRDGRKFAGLAVGDKVRPLESSTDQLLADWDRSFADLSRMATEAGEDWLELAGLDVLLPYQPGAILQCGANYRKHVVDIVMTEIDDHRGRPEAEVRAEAEAMMDSRAANGKPYVFVGLPGALTGPFDDVILPADGGRPDWELELAVVIGREARRVTPERALAHVAAYTIANDLTSRDLVYRPDLKKIGTDWLAAKCSPTFLPVGPLLVPAAFVPDPMDLRITLTHNGRVMQDESTADMIFDVARIISYCSERTVLRPGDLVLTGSPAGNGVHWGVFLAAGDVMEGTITGLGTQRNRCVDEVA